MYIDCSLFKLLKISNVFFFINFYNKTHDFNLVKLQKNIFIGRMNI